MVSSPQMLVVLEPGCIFQIGDPDVLRFSYGSDPTLAQCLALLGEQGIAQVRVAGTDEFLTLDAARELLVQDGTASSLASVTLPQYQLSVSLGAWWQLPQTSQVFIPGHIIQLKEGEGWVARFYYGDRERQ